MMKELKDNIIKYGLLYFLLLIILLNHSLIINVIANINKFFLNNNDNRIAEINTLKQENSYLKDEIYRINKLSNYANYDYKITRLSYRTINNKNIFYINGGLDNSFKANDLLVNEYGVVGVVDKVYSTYSKCQTLMELNNFSIKVNESYGIINQIEDGLLVASNFSIDDKVNLNDIVYTSELGKIKVSMKIGKVKSIDETNLSKTIYIEPYVNFNDISYLYVIGE